MHERRVLPIGVQLHRLALGGEDVGGRHPVHPSAISHQLRRVRVTAILLEARLVWMGRGGRGGERGWAAGVSGGVNGFKVGGRGLGGGRGAWVGIRMQSEAHGIGFDPFDAVPHRTRLPPKRFPVR